MTAEEFERFARALLPRLARFATGIVGAADAEDICQATLVTLWKKNLPLATSEAQVRQQVSFAYQVANGHIANLLRGRSRRNQLIRNQVSEHNIMYEPDEIGLIHNAGQDSYLSLLALVNESDRKVLALIVEGFTIKEISELLGCSISAAKMRAHRARNRLRTALDNSKEDPGHERERQSQR